MLEHLAHLQLEALESIVVHHPPWLPLTILSLHYHPTLAAPRPFYQDFRTHQKWIQRQEFQSFSGPISQELSFLLKIHILKKLNHHPPHLLIYTSILRILFFVRS